MKYLSNKKGFLGIDNKFNFKEKVVIIPFGLEKTVSYGGGTKNGPKEIIKASHQVELYDEEFNCEPFRKIGIKTIKPFKISKNIKIALSDPMRSSLFSHIKNNRLESSGNSITEGIGTARITKNFEKALVDDAFQTNDTEALKIVFDLIENQKIILGGSSGINIAGAIKLAQKMGPGKTIVTILCDHGKRYASKIFNKEFLKSKNLPIPKWL